MQTEAYEHLQVGDWRVTRSTGELSRGSERRRIEPKVMELLILLAEHGGEVVSHEEISKRLWPRMVVGEDTLARTMSKLRKALDDTSRPARLIGTVPKRGYRLLQPARGLPSDPAPVLQPVVRRQHARRVWMGVGAAVAGFIAVGIAVLAPMHPTKPQAAAPETLVEHAEDFYSQYSYADNQAAIALYERILELRPDYARAYAGLANALVQKAVRWPTPHGRTYTQLRDALNSGSLESDANQQLLARAQRFAELAVDLAPQDAAAHKAFGLVRSARGDFEGALAAYHRAVRLDRDAWGALINIGDVLEIAGREEEALPYFEAAYSAMTRVYGAQAARTRPWYAALGVLVGDRYLERGELLRAERAYRQVLAHAPLHEAATRQLAEILRRRGDGAAAQNVCSNFARRLGATATPGATACS